MADPDIAADPQGAIPARSDTAIAGVEGYLQGGGVVVDDPLSKLNGPRGRTLYREMAESDTTVGAVLFGLEMWLRCVPWTFEPVTRDDRDAMADAEFIESVVMEDTGRAWEEFISDLRSTWVYGWSWFDLPLKRRQGFIDRDELRSSRFDDGMMGLQDFAFRPQETLLTWDIDSETGYVRGWRQTPPQGGRTQYLDKHRALHLIGRTNKGSPEGASILRNAYRAYYYLKNIQSIEAIAIERELNGFPVVKVPSELMNRARPGPDATPDPAAVLLLKQYEDMARNIKNNHQAGAVVVSDPWRDGDGRVSTMPQYEIQLLNTNGQRAIDTTRVKEGYQQDVARSMLFDFVMLGQGDKGSFALSQSKIDMCISGVEGWVRMLEDGINRSVIPRIWRANGKDMSRMPRAKAGKVQKATLDSLGQYIERVSRSGFDLTQSAELRQELLNAADLPGEIQREENEE